MAATNNQANHSYVEANPEDEDPPYAAVASNVAIQTAKPKIVEEIVNLQVGHVEGNRSCSSLLVQSRADDSGLGPHGCPGHDLYAQTYQKLGVGGDAHH